MTDTLKPKLIWIENRCYRFCDSNPWSQENDLEPYQEDYQEDCDNMSDNGVFECEQMYNGKYKHEFSVPKAFYGIIVGFKGSTKKTIESDTKTTIKVPRPDAHDEIITITGFDQSGVRSCRQRIELLMENSRNKIRFTHFVSIPLNTDPIISKFEELKNEILSDPDHESKGIIEDIFVNKNKLHLTIGMLRLLSEKEKEEAMEFLTECVNEVIKPLLNKNRPLIMKVQGLECMNDDPSRVSVLYAKVLENPVLQEMANKIFAFFIQKGIMSIERTENVNLHMTLMKISKLNRKQDKPKDAPRAQPFNATKLFQNYKDYYFGEVELNTINISEMSSAEDGQYITLKSVDLLA